MSWEDLSPRGFIADGDGGGSGAVKKAEAHINQFLFQGGPDTETDDVRFAGGFGAEAAEQVRVAWRDAKTTAEDMERGWTGVAGGKPKEEEPKPEEPVEPKKAAVGSVGGGWVKERFLRILQGEKPQGEKPHQRVVALKVIEQRKPEPEEEPEEPEVKRGAASDSSSVGSGSGRLGSSYFSDE